MWISATLRGFESTLIAEENMLFWRKFLSQLIHSLPVKKRIID